MDAKILGLRIKQARTKLGLSQRKLAEMISSDQVTVSHYESGQRKVSVVDLPSIAQALDVPVLYFFTDEIETDALDQTMLVEFQRLPSLEFKETAIDLVHSLTKLSAKI